MSSSTKDGSATSKEELAKHIQHLYAKINTLEGAAKKGGGGDGHAAKIKAPKPEPYEGGRDNVQTFLTQMSAYLHVNEALFSKEAEKVMCAGGMLRGKAAEWFEPTLRDYLENDKKANRRDDTNEMFGDFDVFAKNLRDTFGNPDELRTAERQLMQLKQRGSAGIYVADFKRIAVKVHWGEQALIVCFYNGLRDDVKDELSREARSEILSEITDKAIRIDNRLYERRLERKGHNTVPWGQRQANSGRRRSTAYGHHSGPMELDAAHRDSKPKGKCYNCGKEGHYANKCRQKKNWKPVPERAAQVAERNELPERNVSVAARAPARGELRWDDPLARSQQYQDMIQDTEYEESSDSSSSTEDGEILDEDDEERHMPPFLVVPGYNARDAGIVLGVLETAFDESEQDQRMTFGDNISIHPQMENHEEVSWVSCVFATCETHLWEKLDAKWIPRRGGNQPINDPYKDTQILGWREHSRTRSHLYIVPIAYGRCRQHDARIDHRIEEIKQHFARRRQTPTLPQREETSLEELPPLRRAALLRPIGPAPPRSWTEQEARAMQALAAVHELQSGNDNSRL